MSVDVVQLRRDQVLRRVELAVTNRSAHQITIQRVRLRVTPFALPGWVEFGEPLPAGQTVNLPVEFHRISCPNAGPPAVGPAKVDLELTNVNTARAFSVATVARVPDQLLRRISTRSCAVDRVREEVQLRLRDRWRLTTGPTARSCTAP